MVSLGQYKVPAEPFRKLVEAYLAEKDMSITRFSEECGLEGSSLGSILTRDKIRFDLADRIVCESYGPLLWQEPPYVEIYWQGNPPPDALKPEKCARQGCDKWFSLRGEDARGDHQRYCSRSCVSIASGHRLGKHKPRELMCRNGHKRTPENVVIGSRGERHCLECRRETSRQRQKRETPEQRAARLQYHREYYAKKKSA